MTRQNYQNTLGPPAPEKKTVVVVAPLPAQGHMNQLLHLSRLLASCGLSVHFVGEAQHNRRAVRRAHGWDPLSTPNLYFHDIQTAPFPSPPPASTATETVSSGNFPSHLVPAFRAASRHLRRPVASLLRRLAPAAERLVVVHDSLMASTVQDAAAIPNSECFTFNSISAFAILLFYCGGQVINGVDVPSGVPSLEGCMSPDMMDFIAGQYEFNRTTSGNLYNTSPAIELPFVESLTKVLPHKKHFAIGPFNLVAKEIKKKEIIKKRHPCMEWLDRQAKGSVVYVSFGTTTTFGVEQEREIGLGLRESRHKFLWAVREADRGDGILVLSSGDERMKFVGENGVLVRDWAPQPEILAHAATGGFVSHCGWNSCVEGISGGVAIGTWPMHSDQPRNAVLVNEVLRVGIPVREWRDRDGVASAKTVAEGVKRLMGAAEIRKRVAELGEKVRRSVEEGGSKELDAFVAHITR